MTVGQNIHSGYNIFKPNMTDSFRYVRYINFNPDGANCEFAEIRIKGWVLHTEMESTA
jgi:hypothetical protein